MYILLADDSEDGFHTDSDWSPLLHEYQQVAINMMTIIVFVMMTSIILMKIMIIFTMILFIWSTSMIF